MSSSSLPNLDYVYFRSPFFWLCLTPNSSYFKFLICQLTKFIMPISKGLIPNSILCLIPKVLLQCHVFRHFMPNSKGLPTPIRYKDLIIQPLSSKIATVNSFEVAIFNGLCLLVVNFTIFKQIFFENSDRAAYSDLNPVDGGQSLYPMGTVYHIILLAAGG